MSSVGDLVRVKSTGAVGRIAQTNGHAHKVGGTWVLATDVELASPSEGPAMVAGTSSTGAQNGGYGDVRGEQAMSEENSGLLIEWQAMTEENRKAITALLEADSTAAAHPAPLPATLEQQQLLDLGFSREQSAAAVRRHSSIEACVEWILTDPEVQAASVTESVAIEALDANAEAQPAGPPALERLVSQETLQAIAALEEADAAVAPTLQNTANHSLAVVGSGLLRALAGKRGVDILELSSPLSLGYGAKQILREMLTQWLDSFGDAIRRLSAEATDAEAMSSLASAMHGLMQLVAVWCGDSSQEQIMKLTHKWILLVLVNLTGSQKAAAGINTERLQQMMSMALAQAHQDPQAEAEPEDVAEVLRGFGCKTEAIANMAENVAVSLLQKLRQWEENEEDEMFTSRPLVEAGHITAGLGLIVRGGAGNGPVHVFVYDLPKLQEWVEKSHTDPNTSEELNVGEIIEIS